MALQPVAVPGRCGAVDREQVGEVGDALRSPRGQHNKGAMLLQRDLGVSDREGPRGHRHESPTGGQERLALVFVSG